MARDFGEGTSSRSSRLIHGGLRYLEQGRIHLVFEALRERRHPAPPGAPPGPAPPFLFPVFQGDRVPRWKPPSGSHCTTSLPRGVMCAATGRSASEPCSSRAADPGTGLDRRRAILSTPSATTPGWWWRRSGRRDPGARWPTTCGSPGSSPRCRVVGRAASGPDDRRGREVRARRRGQRHRPLGRQLRRLEDPAALALLRPPRGSRGGAARPGRQPPRGDLHQPGRRAGHVRPPWGEVDLHRHHRYRHGGGSGGGAVDRSDVVYLLRSANALYPGARLDPADVVAELGPGSRPCSPPTPAAPASAVSREHRTIARGPGGLSPSRAAS